MQGFVRRHHFTDRMSRPKVICIMNEMALSVTPAIGATIKLFDSGMNQYTYIFLQILINIVYFIRPFDSIFYAVLS